MFDRVVDRIGDPLLHAAGVVGTTVGGGAVIFAQQVQQGWDSTTSVLAGVFGAGCGALGVMWKAMRADQAKSAEQRDNDDHVAAELRRVEDARRLAELEHERAEKERLQARVDELVDRIIDQIPPAPPSIGGTS